MDALYRLNLGNAFSLIEPVCIRKGALGMPECSDGAVWTGSEATRCRVIGEAMGASSGVFRL
jgi:hypothetical protein